MTAFSIFIIDDNETDRYLLKRLIKAGKLSDTIFEAENGREALNFLKQNISDHEEIGRASCRERV